MKAEAVARRILRESPTAEEAFVFLAARSRDTEDWSGLCTLIEQRLPVKMCLMELAHLHELQGDQELALALSHRAETSPERFGCLGALLCSSTDRQERQPAYRNCL